MSTLTRLEPSPDLVEQVYQRLLDAISDGSMAPGTRLTQEDVAEQLAVSRQPVLQALRLLKADGLVLDCVGPQGQKGRGLVVAPIDIENVVHIYEVRSALDALAARLAAQRRTHIDPGLVARGRAAAAGTDIRAMMDADLAFHCAIYQASGNPLIEGSATLHWQHIRRAMGEALQAFPLRATVWDEHQAMVDAIAQGDDTAASQLMLAHGAQASEYLHSQLKASASPPLNSVVR
jgi:DNA-binding GntR family transcriptional regulator